MRTILLATVTVLFASTGIALAGEGNGEPFAGPDFAVTSRTDNATLAMKGQDPFSFAAGSTAMRLGGTYKQAQAKNQDPFPFSATPGVIGQPSPSTVVQRGAGQPHG